MLLEVEGHVGFVVACLMSANSCRYDISQAFSPFSFLLFHISEQRQI